MKKILTAIILCTGAFLLSACSSDTVSDKPTTIPTRDNGTGDLPWDRPASWEGGLPGMGGIGNPTRY